MCLSTDDHIQLVCPLKLIKESQTGLISEKQIKISLINGEHIPEYPDSENESHNGLLR